MKIRVLGLGSRVWENRDAPFDPAIGGTQGRENRAQKR